MASNRGELITEFARTDHVDLSHFAMDPQLLYDLSRREWREDLSLSMQKVAIIQIGWIR